MKPEIIIAKLFYAIFRLHAIHSFVDRIPQLNHKNLQ